MLSQRHVDLRVWSYPRHSYILQVSSKFLSGVWEHLVVEICQFPLLWLLACTTACSTLQAVNKN